MDFFEHARRRPGMYIGSTDAPGMWWWVRVLINSAIDAYLVGAGSHISVALRADGAIRVTSDALTLPTSFPSTLPALLRDVFLRPFPVWTPPPDRNAAGWPLDLVRPSVPDLDEAYRVSDGMRSAYEWCLLTALARALTVEVHDGEHCWRQVFREQQPVGDALLVGVAPDRATIVTVYPDAAIFGSAVPEWERIFDYLQQSSYLVPGLTLRVVDERPTPARVQTFPATTGVTQYLAEQRHGPYLLTQPFVIAAERERTQIHIALQVSAGRGEVRSFVNNWSTPNGGAHVTGVRDAVRRTSGATGGAAFRRAMQSLLTHLTGIVSIWTPHPLFRGATRAELYNPEIRRVVRAVTAEALVAHVERHPDDLRRLLALLPSGV